MRAQRSRLLEAIKPRPRGTVSLRQRLVVLLLAVGLTPLVVSQLITLGAFLNQERHHMFSVVAKLASEKVQEAQTLLTTKGIQLDQLVQAAKGQPELVQQEWRQQASQLAFSELLLVDRSTLRVSAAALHPQLVGLDLNSERLRASGLSTVVRNIRAWNQVSVTPLASDPALGGVAAWLAVPLQEGTDNPLVLVGRLDGAAFQAMAFKRQRHLEHGAAVQLATLRSDGRRLQFVPLGIATANPPSPALLIKPSGLFGISTADLRGDGGTAYVKAANGQELLASWRQIPFSPVVVLITIPQEEYGRDSQALTRMILAILLVTAGLVALGGVILGRRLVRPLRDLHQAVQDFNPDDPRSLHPVAVNGRDEIASLASTVNAMVTRIQAHNAKLLAAKDELNTTIQTVQTTLLALDRWGRITLLNRSGRSLLGLPENDGISWLGADWVEHWVAQADQPLARHWLEAAGRGELPPAGQLDYHVQTQHRGERLVHWHLSLLEDDAGQVSGLLCSGEDITDRQIQAAALEQARQDAERANAAKSDFLSRMSHELRTPMNAIIGMTHLALRTDLDRRQRDYLQKINAAGQNLLEIINDILDFSKIEAGKMQLEMVAFQLDDVLGNVANLVADRVFANGVELLFCVEDDVPSSLKGDPLRLTQVLLNLLSNAAKFTERGEILLRVSLVEQCERQEEQRERHEAQRERQVTLQFAVQDSGIGMTEEQAARLFQMFNQAEASTTRRYGGTGLGLSICQRLLTLMGGSIRVESRLGEGSCFTAVAPFALGEGAPRRVVPDALNGLRVLVVDDNALARVVMQDLLAPLPLRCDLAASGAEALARVQGAAQANDPYGLLLLDWHLDPDLDGLAVAQQLRSDPQLPQPRIVMVTAFGFEEALQQAPEGVLDACLSKPVQPSALIDTLADLFGGPRAEPPSDRGAGRQGDGEPSRLQGLRVLVVEDNLINQQIVQELLQIVGVAVSTASNGVEALAWLEAHSGGPAGGPEGEPVRPCDLVLLDLNMPEMDGWECAQRIHADHRWRDLPLLAMTAHAMQQERDRCLALGMQDHITKPIDPQLLYERLGHWGGRPAPADGPSGSAAAAAAQQPPAQSPSLPPEAAELARQLPGFDVPRALKRVGGNADLYRRLLGSLVHTQADADLRLAEALTTADLRQAEQIVHMVKGVAANLGALALADAASRLDAELKQGRAPADLQATFVKALQHTMTEISWVLAVPAEDGQPGGNRGALASTAIVPPASGPITAAQADLIRRLDALLAVADGEALELVEQERAAFAAVLGTTALAALNQALERFDFQASRLLLKPFCSQVPAATPQ